MVLESVDIFVVVRPYLCCNSGASHQSLETWFITSFVRIN